MLAWTHVVIATAAQMPEREAEPEYRGDHHEGSGAAADDRKGEPWVCAFAPATHLERAPAQEGRYGDTKTVGALGAQTPPYAPLN